MSRVMLPLWMYEDMPARSDLAAGQEPMARLRVRCSAAGGLRVIGVDLTPDLPPGSAPRICPPDPPEICLM